MPQEAIKENDTVLCTVKKIEGTSVFVHIEEDGEGSINMSEIAAGRIRNLRVYVFPNKKIVCKVLKVTPANVELSLRRVTGKERDSIMQRYKKEKNFQSMLKAAFPNYQEIIAKIKEKYSLSDFYDAIKENPSVLETIMNKTEAKDLMKIIVEKGEKEKEVKKIFILKSFSDSGIKDIKKILENKSQGIEIRYLGSSQFLISTSSYHLKEADHKLSFAIQEIQNKAKEKKAHFELKEVK